MPTMISKPRWAVVGGAEGAGVCRLRGGWGGSRNLENRLHGMNDVESYLS